VSDLKQQVAEIQFQKDQYDQEIDEDEVARDLKAQLDARLAQLRSQKKK
jgi:hypothetical protein